MTPSWPVSTEEVAINPGFDGMDTCHHGDPRRMAGRSSAMSVGKGNRLFGEAIEVGCDDSRVIGQRGDVVVEVVY